MAGRPSSPALKASPLGSFGGRFLVQWAGVRATLLVLGTCYLATTVSLLVNPALRSMEKPGTLPFKQEQPQQPEPG